jgi:hypothetical protein
MEYNVHENNTQSKARECKKWNDDHSMILKNYSNPWPFSLQDRSSVIKNTIAPRK